MIRVMTVQSVTRLLRPMRHMRCLVPYRLVGRTVDIRLGAIAFAVLDGGETLAEHGHLRSRMGQYSTDPAYMPPEHLEARGCVPCSNILSLSKRERAARRCFASQLEPDQWYPRISSELCADSILNRAVEHTRALDIKGPTSASTRPTSRLRRRRGTGTDVGIRIYSGKPALTKCSTQSSKGPCPSGRTWSLAVFACLSI